MAADSAWVPAVAASIVADFRSLPSNMQTNLLLSRWNIIGGPAMLPILREIYAYPLEQQAAREIAVRRIYELAPEEGRRIILSQLTQTNTYLSAATLEMLPDRSLPELSDNWQAVPKRVELEDALILRYATRRYRPAGGAGLPQAQRRVRPPETPALRRSSHLLFPAARPAFGERELRSDMDKPAAFPVCYDIGFQFQSLDRNAYSPALERLAIEFLGQPYSAGQARRR